MNNLSAKKSYRFEVEYTTSPSFPREVFFDIAGACNHSCFFCGNAKTDNNVLLDKNLVFRLLKEAMDNGVTDVALYATGEPLLHPDLAEMTREAKRLGIHYLFISTNGALATPKRAKPILDAGMDSIKFSVNGGTRESYKNVHGRDQFERVISHIKWFSEYRQKSGLKYKIYVSSVQSTRNIDEWQGLENLLSPFVDEMDVRHVSNQGGNMYENNLTEEINPNNLLGSLQNNQMNNLKNKCCPDPFHRLTVTPEGYASVCVVDYKNYLTVADLNKSTLLEAWNSDLFVNLRKKHLENKLDGLICKNCLYNSNEPYDPLMPSLSRACK